MFLKFWTDDLGVPPFLEPPIWPLIPWARTRDAEETWRQHRQQKDQSQPPQAKVRFEWLFVGYEKQ